MKNTANAAITTFDNRPVPNHMMNMGAMAKIGTAPAMTKYGREIRAMSGLSASRNPAAVPSTVPSSKPVTASSEVVPTSIQKESLTLSLQAT
jgi:hypothetical protein